MAHAFCFCVSLHCHFVFTFLWISQIILVPNSSNIAQSQMEMYLLSKLLFDRMNGRDFSFKNIHSILAVNFAWKIGWTLVNLDQKEVFYYKNRYLCTIVPTSNLTPAENNRKQIGNKGPEIGFREQKISPSNGRKSLDKSLKIHTTNGSCPIGPSSLVPGSDNSDQTGPRR